MKYSHELNGSDQRSFRFAAIVVGAFLALTVAGGVAYWLAERNTALPKEGVTLSATVKFIGIEGGCWMLDTKYGSFLAGNLAKEFRLDGLKLTATVKLAESQAHFCPMGRGIVIVSNPVHSGA